MPERLVSERQVSTGVTSSNYGDRTQSLGSFQFDSDELVFVPEPVNEYEYDEPVSKNDAPLPDWTSIINDAVYFYGSCPTFGNLVAVIFEDPRLNTGPSCVLISAKYGEFLFRSMTITSKSKFFPAVENLPKKMQSSNVRRALAIALLKLGIECELDWDDTDSGELAGRLTLVDKQTPIDSGNQIFKLGYFQSKVANSLLVDVVYDNNIDEDLSNRNNQLAFLLGEQLDNLFDPFTEYSPEPTERVYAPPAEITVTDDVLVKSICHELLRVQTNFTVSLVTFLQKFIIPLRIKVLEGKVPGWTTPKLNQVFPPTIDEVTRINCIFLDALKLTKGESFEVMKACAMTLPYFYKAYMRHEAATKNLHQSLELFLREIPAEILENKNYDRHAIESIMHSSLNLAKIKTILTRMVKTKHWDGAQLPDVESYYENVCSIIDSFGMDKLKPYNNRVFTPTGKLLTELASGWPSELHYGWLNRRVVAVFDVEYLMEPSIYNYGLVILFSDHMVFLQIDDDEYYYMEHTGSAALLYKPSIADMMMHSLINEVPLSADIPHLKVSFWTDISKVFALSYDEGESVCLKIGNDIRMMAIKNTRVKSGEYVVDLINKAKVLNKSQLFHLFKSDYEGGSSIYYTAQELEAYKDEKNKSPMTIFLNMNANTALLDDFGLERAIVLTIKDSEHVEVTLVSREEVTSTTILTAKFSETLSQTVLEKLVDQVYGLTTEQESAIMDSLVQFFSHDRHAEERALAVRLANRPPQPQEHATHSSSHSKTLSNFTTSTKTRISSSGTVRKQVVEKEPKKWIRTLKTKVSKVFKKKSRETIVEDHRPYAQSEQSSTMNMTTTSSSLLVNSKFEFPLKEPPAVVIPKMDHLSTPVIPEATPVASPEPSPEATPVASPAKPAHAPLAVSTPPRQQLSPQRDSPVRYRPLTPPRPASPIRARPDLPAVPTSVRDRSPARYVPAPKTEAPTVAPVVSDKPVPLWKSPEVTKNLELMLRELSQSSLNDHNWSLLDAESNTSFHDALMDNSRFAKMIDEFDFTSVSQSQSKEVTSLAKLMKEKTSPALAFEGFPEILKAPKRFGVIQQQQPQRVVSDATTDDDNDRFYTPKEHPSEFMDNSLEDDSNSTISASLIDPSLLIPRERLLEQITTDDTVLSGESFNYIGDILGGNIEFQREDSSKLDAQFDKNLDIAFASRLRDSSAKYLANFIHSGYTQADIHRLLSEGDVKAM